MRVGRRHSLRGLAAALGCAALAAAAPLGAQGNLSTQGLGYAPGQLSARAKTTGGALGETDPASALNPAALINWGASALYFQAEPEYRRVTAGGVEDRTSEARYPLTAGAIGIGQRWMLGLAVSNLLDRTWTTRERTSNVANGDTLFSTTTLGSAGGINDIRLGLAFAPRAWLRFGIGAHAYTGRNELVTRREFDDSVSVFSDTTFTSYGGRAFSAGTEVLLGRVASLAASYRKGGGIAAETGALPRRKANVPDRIGLSVAYLGITGTTIAVRASRDNWSSLEPLATLPVRPRDAWDFGVGAEAPGPRLGERVIQLRVGGRWRTLPYEAAGNEVRERTLSGGFGTVLGRGRALVDVGVLRILRDTPSGAAADVRERAWAFSVGLSVRP